MSVDGLLDDKDTLQDVREAERGVERVEGKWKVEVGEQATGHRGCRVTHRAAELEHIGASVCGVEDKSHVSKPHVTFLA